MGSPLLGVGVITSGWVEVHSGVVRSQPLLGWCDVPLRRLLEEVVDVPVVLEQTARALATADLLHDLVGGATDFLHIFVGNALEAAAVVGGHVGTARDGFGGDLSRWPLDDGGRTTTAATVISDAGLIAKAQRIGVPLGAGHLDELLAWRGDDAHGAAVDSVLAGAARGLGRLLASASDLLGPSLVVVTSHLGAFDDHFHLVEEEMVRGADLRRAPVVQRSRSAGHPAVSPAAAVALAQVLDAPLTRVSASISSSSRTRTQKVQRHQFFAVDTRSVRCHSREASTAARPPDDEVEGGRHGRGPNTWAGKAG